VVEHEGKKQSIGLCRSGLRWFDPLPRDRVYSTCLLPPAICRLGFVDTLRSPHSALPFAVSADAFGYSPVLRLTILAAILPCAALVVAVRPYLPHLGRFAVQHRLLFWVPPIPPLPYRRAAAPLPAAFASLCTTLPSYRSGSRLFIAFVVQDDGCCTVWRFTHSTPTRFTLPHGICHAYYRATYACGFVNLHPPHAFRYTPRFLPLFSLPTRFLQRSKRENTRTEKALVLWALFCSWWTILFTEPTPYVCGRQRRLDSRFGWVTHIAWCCTLFWRCVLRLNDDISYCRCALRSLSPARFFAIIPTPHAATGAFIFTFTRTARLAGLRCAPPAPRADCALC